MPEWERIVRHQLRAMRLPPGQRAEVVRELAAHLSDEFDLRVSAGEGPGEALNHVLREVPDWNQLGREIETARGDDMLERDRKVLLPGLTVFMLSALSEAALLRVGVVPRFLPVLWDGYYIKLSIVWLCLLPFYAALGAYWSRRWGGSNLHRVLAGCFPALAFLGLLAFIGVWAAALTIAGVHGAGTGLGFLLVAFTDFAIPCAALLLGCVPFLDFGHRRQELGSVEAVSGRS